MQRQRAVRMLGDVGHGKIIGDERVRQATERKGHQQRQGPCGRVRHRDPRGVAVRGARDGQDRLHQRHGEGERKGELSELGDHGALMVFCALAPCSSACAASGGM